MRQIKSEEVDLPFAANDGFAKICSIANRSVRLPLPHGRAHVVTFVQTSRGIQPRFTPVGGSPVASLGRLGLRSSASEEAVMAKAKRRVARKSSKRRKARVTSARKKVAKRAAPKKAKSKLRKTPRGARKSTARKKQSPKTAARKALRKPPRKPEQVPVVDKIVDIVEAPAPTGVPVTEHEVVRTIAPCSDSNSEADKE